MHNTNQMLIAMAFGQDIDVKRPTTETTYWQIVENKSAAFFGAALLLGAVLGCASEKIASGVKRFGQLYGEMIQIHDDLNDSMAVPANPDWLQKRAPLPILFAQIVDHPDRKRFLDLYENITEPEALKEAQEILIHCGAVSYCIDQLLHRHQAAQKILDITQLVNEQMLYDLSNEIVEPVWNVFNLLGMQSLTPFLSRMERAG